MHYALKSKNKDIGIESRVHSSEHICLEINLVSESLQVVLIVLTPVGFICTRIMLPKWKDACCFLPDLFSTADYQLMADNVCVCESMHVEFEEEI